MESLWFCESCLIGAKNWTGALVQWLWEETHVQAVMGLNLSIANTRLLFHIYLL